MFLVFLILCVLSPVFCCKVSECCTLIPGSGLVLHYIAQSTEDSYKVILNGKCSLAMVQYIFQL